MNELKTAVLIIAAAITAFVWYFIYRIHRNRKYWIRRLRPGDTVRYGQDERIGVISATYLNTVLIIDKEDLQPRKVFFSELKPL